MIRGMARNGWFNTVIKLPSGGENRLCQPKHKTALELDADSYHFHQKVESFKVSRLSAPEALEFAQIKSSRFIWQG